MSIPRLAALLVLPALVAACSSDVGGIVEDSAGEPGGGGLVLTADGLPGLPAGTPYSEAAIETALPGFDASTITMATETGTESALALFRNGLQVVQVLPGSAGAIGAVHAVSTDVVGPAGERVGMTVAEARVASGGCRLGSGNWLGMPICPSRAAPNVTLVFATTGLAQTAAEAIATATLQRMIWQPAGAPGESS